MLMYIVRKTYKLLSDQEINLYTYIVIERNIVLHYMYSKFLHVELPFK